MPLPAQKLFIPHVRRDGGNHAVVCLGCGAVRHAECLAGGAFLEGTPAWFCHQACLARNRAKGLKALDDHIVREEASRKVTR